MKIALCHIPVEWESPELNLKNCSRLCNRIINEDSGTDLIVSPEFFTYGFSMNGSIAESEEGKTIKWLKETSSRLNIAILGGVPVISGGKLFNRAVFALPDGNLRYYDKRHLFSYGKEDKVFSPGNERVIVEFKGWNILLQICYDLRFPVWSRNVNLEYDLVINIASWPSSRAGVVEPMVRSRAIENLSYYAFLNRAGSDPESDYMGERYLSDFRGNLSLPFLNDPEDMFTMFILHKESLADYREKFCAWKDADSFTID